MAAESLVELNSKAFGNKLYEDLDEKREWKFMVQFYRKLELLLRTFAAEVENVKKLLHKWEKDLN